MRSLKCSPDGKYVACGDQNGALKIYETSTGTLTKDLNAHIAEITCIDFVQDGDMLLMATGSRDRLIHLYDTKANFTQKNSIEDHNSAIVALAFALDKKEQDPNKRIRLISCGADKGIVFRYISRNFQATQYHQEIDKQCKPLCLTINPFTLHAIVGQERKISIWRISTGKLIRTFELKEEAKKQSVNNISVLADPTSTFIVSSCSDKMIKLRDFINGRCLLKIGNAGSCTALALTNDCKRLITVSMEGCIMIWTLPEDLTAHCQKRMRELSISTSFQGAIPKKEEIKTISELEMIAEASPKEKRQKEREKNAKESSEAAMNAAAYIQNLLAQHKNPAPPSEENASKLSQSFSLTKEEDHGQKEQNLPKELRASKSATSFHQEIEQSNANPMATPSKDTNSIITESQRSVVNFEPEEKKKEEKSQISLSEDVKEDQPQEAVALEEEENPVTDETDVLGLLMMRQRDVAEEPAIIGQKIPDRKKESISSMYFQKKFIADEEFKNAYMDARKNPNKRDKDNLIFESKEMEKVQTKLPNYAEVASGMQAMLKEIAKPVPPIAEKEEKKLEILPCEYGAQSKPDSVEIGVSPRERPKIISKDIQTEEPNEYEQLRNDLINLKEKIKGKPNKKEIENLIPYIISINILLLEYGKIFAKK